MRICRVCNKVSATGSDHTDCIQQRRIEMEDGGLKESIPEKLDMAKDPGELGVEIRAILEHLAREKAESGGK